MRRGAARVGARAQSRQQALAHALQQLLGQRDEVRGGRRRRVPPDDAISLGVHDLHRHAEPVALLLELAREDARCVELAARGLRVDVLSGVPSGGREGADGQPGGVGERGGNFVGERQAQVVDGGVSQDVLERKNRNHRLGRRGGRGTAATHDSPDEPGREEDGDTGRHLPVDAGAGRRRRRRGSAAAPGRFRVPLQALQIGPQIRCALVAKVAVFFERGADDPLELSGHGRIQRVCGYRRAIEDRVEDDCGGVSRKRLPPGGHLVEHGAAREHIGARVESLAPRLLGRHVGDRSDRGARVRQPGFSDRRRGGRVERSRVVGLLRETEVEKLRLSSFGDEDVRGLQVAVDDAPRVRGFQRVRDLDRDVEEGRELEWAGDQAVMKRFAVEQLHGDEGFALVLVDVIDGADVGVLERGGRPGLALQPLEGLRIRRGLLRKKLQGHAAAELQVLGFVNDSHPAASELREDPVMREGLTDHA